MLRPNPIPFDTYLGDAFSLDVSVFVGRHPWPMVVIPDPDPAVISRIRRAETVIDGLAREDVQEFLSSPAAASLDALCLEASPKPGRTPESVSIGRSKDADVVLLDESISRIHALLAWDAKTERITITDLGARNGTRADGKSLTAEVPTVVPSGAVVCFGALVTRVYCPRSFYEWLRSGAPRSGAAPGNWPQR